MSQSFVKLTKSENFRFNAVLFGPQLLHGPVMYRPRGLAVTERLGTAGKTVAFVDAIRQRYGEGPLWVQAGRHPTLLVLAPRHIRQVLENSPEVFASDSIFKKEAFGHFAPNSAVVSRGREWRSRHAFVHSVYQADRPVHQLAETILALCASALTDLLRALDPRRGRLTLADLRHMHSRLARRILFGEAAADDEQISRWMEALATDANLAGLKARGKHAHLLPLLLTRIGDYAAVAEPGSVVAMFGSAPVDESTSAPSQMSHAFYNLSVTAAWAVSRCLALIAGDADVRDQVIEELGPADLLDPAAVTGLTYLDGCLLETLRLYPVPLIYREAARATDFDGVPVPAGAQILILNVFNHRDARRHWFADRFEPSIWSTEAAADWTLNPFSRGPQDCTGSRLLMLVCKAIVGGFFQARRVHLGQPALGPLQPLPHSLNATRIRLTLSRRA